MSLITTNSVLFRGRGLSLEDLISILIVEVPDGAKNVRVMVYKKFESDPGTKIKVVQTRIGDLSVDYHLATDKFPDGSVMIGYTVGNIE